MSPKSRTYLCTSLFLRNKVLTPLPVFWRGEEQGSKSPFSPLFEPISPSSPLFEPISPSSLNVYLTFSPSSLLFPPISPSSQLFLGHFSLLPILFLPPPFALWRAIMTSWSSPEPTEDFKCFWNLWSSFCLSLSGTLNFLYGSPWYFGARCLLPQERTTSDLSPSSILLKATQLASQFAHIQQQSLKIMIDMQSSSISN